MLNYYEILGVERSCSTAEIRKAYHKLARKYHPDVTLLEKSYAESMMASVSKAYKTLSNTNSRAIYDEKLDYQTPAPQPQNWSQNKHHNGQNFYSNPYYDEECDMFDYTILITTIILSTFVFLLQIIL